MVINSNSIWYLGLGIASVILLAYVYFSKKTPNVLILFLGMVGIGYIIEFVIYILLGSYQYDPKIIVRDEYYDNNLGAAASNMLALPAAATFIAAFRLKLLWIVAITCFFVGVEWLFVHLEIYRHHWWRYGYTAVGLPVYFITAREWYRRMHHPLRGVLRHATLFLILGALLGTLQFIPIAFFNSRAYNVGWFDNPSRDTTAFSTVYWLGLSFLYMIALNLRWKRVWMKYIFPVALMLVIDWILDKTGMMKSFVWWDLVYCGSVCLIGILLGGVVINRLKRGGGQNL